MPRRPIDAKSLLKVLPLFEELDDATLARLASAAKRRPLARGECLFRRGEPATSIHVVVYGEIRLLRPDERGPRLVGTVRPGHSFGEPVLFLERPAMVDAVAATDALVLQLPKETVFAEIERDPRFARLLLASISRRAEALVQELDRQARGGGRSRLVDYLVSHVQPGPGPRVIRLEAPKAAIASRLNVTPAHFSRLLRHLETARLLRVEGRRIVVPDVDALARAAADGDAPAADRTGPSPS